MLKENNQVTTENKQPTESFEQLLLESSIDTLNVLGKVVKGIVVNIVGDSAVIDVGLKSEGRIPLKEFGNTVEIKVLDEVAVYVERLEDQEGMIVLSHEKAKVEASWDLLEEKHHDGIEVKGVMFGRVKGGFTVDIDGVLAFLPGSQLDIRPIKDIDALMNVEHAFKILKIDKIRSNVVISRRAVMEGTNNETREEILSKISEGSEMEGIVKNITDYGAFVDLGGLDGLLHITDMSWSRLSHPTDLIQIGDKLKVKVVQFNRDTGRVSLGMKQLTDDPWKALGSKYTVNDKIVGKIVNIVDYGAFAELESGVEGLIHISDISWTRKNVHPSKVLSLSQEVEAVILEIDEHKRRIALGLKQCSENPWDKILRDIKVGQEIEGRINNVTEFGLFIAVTEDFDGMVHMSDLSWEGSAEDAIKDFEVGNVIKAKVLEIDPAKERIALGVKQLTEDPFADAMSKIKKGAILTCEIIATNERGLEVITNGIKGTIRRNELAKDRSEQKIDRFAVGEKVDARVTNIDKSNRLLNMSIKSREIIEEKEVVAAYGSSNSGASLGDILGAAMDKANMVQDSEEEMDDDEKTDETKSEKVDDKVTSDIPAEKKSVKKKPAAKKTTDSVKPKKVADKVVKDKMDTEEKPVEKKPVAKKTTKSVETSATSKKEPEK